MSTDQAKPRGKIGRIPFAIRQELNLRLRDGEPGSSILAWLNALPEVRKAIASSDYGGGREARPEITPQNLSEYTAGAAYADWLSRQEDVDRTITLSEFANRMAEAAGGDAAAPAMSMAAAKMLSALEALDGNSAVEIAKALAAMSAAESSRVKALTAKQLLDVKRESVALDKRKFQYLLARDALRLFEDSNARAIAEGKGSREEKIQKLLAFMERQEQEGAQP